MNCCCLVQKVPSTSSLCRILFKFGGMEYMEYEHMEYVKTSVMILFVHLDVYLLLFFKSQIIHLRFPTSNNVDFLSVGPTSDQLLLTLS